MHLLRLYTIKALKRSSETMYGQRRINSLIQKARADQSKKFFTEQEMQRRLAKVKTMLEPLDEAQGESIADGRRQMKIVAELSEFVELIEPDANEEVFGLDDA
jgi:hypothetical protein